MSIDDDYFEVEDAIKSGEIPKVIRGPMERILEAFSHEEKLTMALQDKLRVTEDQINSEIFNKAELEHEIKSLKRLVKNLKKQLSERAPT